MKDITKLMKNIHTRMKRLIILLMRSKYFRNALVLPYSSISIFAVAGIAIGIGIGTALGVAISDIGAGIGMGVAIGVAIGTMMNIKINKKKDDK